VVWLIGIDDTDVPGSRGTGRLARMVAAELMARGMRPCGVTRHQLLVHPDVPYTTHNSAACVAAEGDEPPEDALFSWLCDYVAAHSPDGADPGVCLARAESVGGRVTAFGERAQREVVSADEARALARDGSHLLAGLAGTRRGVIGAIAAVGLRAGGSDGRFIELGRIREIEGAVSVSEILAAGVDRVVAADGSRPGVSDLVETHGWVRPRLSGGRAVLYVGRRDEDDVGWVVADRRRDGHARGRAR